MIIKFLLVVATLVGSFFMLEYAMLVGKASFLAHLRTMSSPPRTYIPLNLLTIGVIWALFMLFCHRVWLASLLCSVFCGILAIVNYYVTTLHGMPLSFLSLKNFATALNVLSSYKFRISRTVIIVILALIVLIALCIIVKCMTIPSKISFPRRLVQSLSLVIVCAFIIYSGYFSPDPIKPKHTINWRWTVAYNQYGYAACTIETLQQVFNSVSKPDNYSEDAVNAISIAEPEEIVSSTPDIILILNESFYDLKEITALETDVDYFANIKSLDNCLFGNAIVPAVGGGTNNSEYELLTSNSLYLMPGVTPFNTLDLKNANSIVSHLSTLGYNTHGSHPAKPINYSRSTGYPALGFDRICFQDNFTDIEKYSTRDYISDQSAYQNLIHWYEEMPEDRPRFQYLLTLQNHGEWDMCDSDADIVHVQNDYGEHTETINEYLTGIHLSDKAFVELTDYFSQCDRPVIICMVGDHSPHFARSIIDDSYSTDEKELLLRKVPLLIWANYPLKETVLDTMSMNYVIPTLFDIADINLSPYYSYMLQLKESVPVLGSYGSYYDIDNKLYSYDADNDAPYENLVDDYFLLEYNNLQADRKQDLFSPYS